MLQVIVKDASEAKAMGDAYDLADALDGADLSSPTGSYGFTSASLYTEPQEITPPPRAGRTCGSSESKRP